MKKKALKIARSFVMSLLMLTVLTAPVIHAYQLSFEIQGNSNIVKCKCCCNCTCSTIKSDSEDHGCQCSIEESAPEIPLDSQTGTVRSNNYLAELSNIEKTETEEEISAPAYPEYSIIIDTGPPKYLTNSSFII